MKKIFTLLLMLITVCTILVIGGNVVEAADGSYYASTEGLTGHALLEELATITRRNHTTNTSYDSLKTHLKSTDPDPNKSGNILDFYSRISTSSWNREHVWPKSLSNGTYQDSKAGADVHHIRPTIEKINSDRGNKLFTDFSLINQKGEEYKYNGQLAAYKTNSYWEPLDNVKGDTARIVMYMYMHYNNTDIKANNGYSMAGDMQITNIVYGGGSEQKAWNVLLYWNKLDPVDDYEANRNNVCASITGTRNPFIDYPEFADAIWDNGTAVNPDDNLGGGTTPDPEEPSTPVVPDTPSVGEGDATLVENASDLKVNDQIIITAKNSSYALGTTQNKSNRAAVSITKSGSAITYGEDTQVITLTSGNLNNTYGLYVGNGYLYAASSSANQLKTETSLTNNSSWEITISNGSAKVVSKGSYSRNILRFNNDNSSNLLFGCYSTGQQDISIYKVNTKTNEPEEDNTNYNSEVTTLFNDYYNNGIYTKETSINLNSEAQKDLSIYFHANCNILNRTTYYNNNELWMSKEDGLYSYYGTNNQGLTYATTDKPTISPVDPKVVVTGTTMLDYYTTLKTLKDNNAVWKKDGTVYYTTDEVILKYYLDFTAPCLLSNLFNTDYFRYAKATVEEVSGTLVMKLYVDGDMKAALTNKDLVLSEAYITISEYSALNSAIDMVNNLDQMTVENDYDLPIIKNGVSISWSGNNVVDNVLKYIKPTNNTTETLTAILKIGEIEKEISIEVIHAKYEEKTEDNEYEYTSFTPEELAIFNDNLGYTIPFIPTSLYEVEIDEVYDAVHYYTYGNNEVEFNNYRQLLLNNGFTEKDPYDYEGVTWYSYTKNGRYLDIAGYDDSGIYVIDVYLYFYEVGENEPSTPTTPTDPKYSTLHFTNVESRDSFTSQKQIWSNEYITLTNSGSCGDYYNPVRFYSSSHVEIQSSYNITQVVFSCAETTSDKDYAEILLDSLIDHYTNVYASNDTVFLTLDNPSDLVEFSMNAQTRVLRITVYFE